MSAYIAFDLDALNVARDVGNACGLDEAHVTHGLLRMWSWCFRSKTDSVNSDHVKGFFGVDACGALMAFGFLAPTGDAFRVRGADRYLRLHEGRKKGGQAAKKNLIPGAVHRKHKADTKPKGVPKVSPRSAEGEPKEFIGSPSALTPSTEHRTPNTSLKDTAAPQSDARVLSDKLVLEFKNQRGSEYRFSKADGVQLAELRNHATDEEILRRWRVGLEVVGFFRTSTIAQLASRWNDLADLRPKRSNDSDIIGHGEITATFGGL